MQQIVTQQVIIITMQKTIMENVQTQNVVLMELIIKLDQLI